MAVCMGMRLARRVIRPMRVLVVCVVHVRMLVLHGLVDVLVPLREMQPDAQTHEGGGGRELHRQRLVEQHQ